MPVLLGETLPSFPGSERGKLALSWESGKSQRLLSREREVVGQVWDPQGLFGSCSLVVSVLVVGLAVGTIPAGAGES